MPFTPTHIAAVLPIAWLFRWRLPFSALAIGSIVCDLGVFFPTLFDYWAMHSASGVLTHCLPLGLALYFGFHWLIKRPLCALLPAEFGLRLTRWVIKLPTLNPGDLIRVAVCITIGAASRAVWDSFTHYQRWGTETFPVLNQVAFETSVRPVYWYTLLQHGSSLIFLPAMIIGAAVWLLRQEKQTDKLFWQPPMALKGFASVLLMGVPIATYTYFSLENPSASQLTVIHEAVKLAGTILIVMSLLYGAAYTVLVNADRAVLCSNRDI